MVLSSDRSAASALVWFRRDLRDFDNTALHAALAVQRSVHCAFVFDTEILDGLERTDRRVTFIWDSVRELRSTCATSQRDISRLYISILRKSTQQIVVSLARSSSADATGK